MAESEETLILQEYEFLIGANLVREGIIPAIFTTDYSDKEIKSTNHISLPIENAQRITEYCERK